MLSRPKSTKKFLLSFSLFIFTILSTKCLLCDIQKTIFWRCPLTSLIVTYLFNFIKPNVRNARQSLLEKICFSLKSKRSISIGHSPMWRSAISTIHVPHLKMGHISSSYIKCPTNYWQKSTDYRYTDHTRSISGLHHLNTVRPFSNVARSVFWAQWWAVQKLLNWSTCHLRGGNLCGPKAPCVGCSPYIPRELATSWEFHVLFWDQIRQVAKVGVTVMRPTARLLLSFATTVHNRAKYQNNS